MIPVPTKVCTTCRHEKPASDFGLRDGRPRSQCRNCVNSGNKRCREKKRAADPRAYKLLTQRYNKTVRANRGPEREAYFRRKTVLKCKYGLTPEQFDAMLAEQNNRCAICRGDTNRWWHVDHNHDTGAIRGILCHGCNTGIGLFNESVESLQAAIEYLKRYSQ